ncbi:MAG: DNA polymerase I [Thermoguttaceae bacterium]
MAKRPRQQSLFDRKEGLPEPAAPGLQEPPGLGVPAIAAQDEPSPESLEGQTVYVIDAHSLIHQLFHAMPEMTSPLGEPVGAVFGFARDLFSLLESKRPDYLFCAFDLPGKTFRHELFEQYKGQRPEMDADLIPQIEAIHQILRALGIPAVGCESYEADDVMATIARIVDERGGECFLVTGDKDCRQLITDRVKLYNMRKDVVFDREALKNDWGIAPEQVVDFQALVGDPTDNVPGVPLIGPKLARQLLEKYGTLEGVFEHIEEIQGQKRKQNLVQGRQQALLSRELVRLKTDVPCAIPWRAARARPIDREGLRALFRRFDFRSLADKADALESPGVEAPGPLEPQAAFHIVDTDEALAALAAELGQQKAIALDLETTDIRPRWADLVGFSFAWEEDRAWYVPVAGPPGERFLDRQQALQVLRPILENPAIGKVGQNLKYDMIVLRRAGVQLAGVAFDTMVASYLLDAGQRSHNLDDLAKRYLGRGKKNIATLIGSGKNQKRMDQVPIQEVAPYACDDALLAWQLRPILAQRLAREGLERLFADLEMPLIHVLVELEYNGIRVDCQRLAELSRRFGEKLRAVEEEIYRLAGRRFHIASPKQLQQVLFREQGLPVLARTKTGPSTDVDVLEQLARDHPLPARILEYRQYAKLQSTYVEALPQMVHPETGRIHASFHQAVAATGRLSSSDPNLQNIPVRTEEGREIRSAFVPGHPGWVLLAADYSQIELRVLAHFSQDQKLCEAFARDEDIHARVASQIYGVPLDQVTGQMRRQAKAVNFGVIYGQSPFGLSKQIGISKEEAARFIDAYFAGYPGIEAFLRRTLEACSKRGYVTTILGRRRAISGVRPGAGRQRNLPERTAINTVIQGSAADLIKLAMVAILRRLRQNDSPARMLLQIHDELVFETPEDRADELARLAIEEMSRAHPLSVPLKVDVKVGPNWADARPWEPAR